MLFRRGGSGFGGGVLGGYLAPARTHKAPHTNTNAEKSRESVRAFFVEPPPNVKSIAKGASFSHPFTNVKTKN